MMARSISAARKRLRSAGENQAREFGGAGHRKTDSRQSAKMTKLSQGVRQLHRVGLPVFERPESKPFAFHAFLKRRKLEHRDPVSALAKRPTER